MFCLIPILELFLCDLDHKKAVIIYICWEKKKLQLPVVETSDNRRIATDLTRQFDGTRMGIRPMVC